MYFRLWATGVEYLGGSTRGRLMVDSTCLGFLPFYIFVSSFWKVYHCNYDVWWRSFIFLSEWLLSVVEFLRNNSSSSRHEKPFPSHDFNRSWSLIWTLCLMVFLLPFSYFSPCSEGACYRSYQNMACHNFITLGNNGGKQSLVFGCSFGVT